MTTKLYWQDSHLTEFQATVLQRFDQAGHTVLELDQTAFYPEGGGQPSDTGWLAEADVAQVESAADGRILHHLEGLLANDFQSGALIQGRINWARRQEMMQQHTGQHLLSQAFFQLFGAETKGFRILGEVTQIDLTLDAAANAVTGALERAEELTNQVIFENRPIRLHEVSPAEAAQLPLRKESFISDCIRVVEIADFDWSPCGGTHAQQTGEVGLLAIRGWERAKQMLRVEFVAGTRLLRDYRANNHLAESLARHFTVSRAEAFNSVQRLEDDHKDLKKRARHLLEIAAQVEAQELRARVGESQGQRIIVRQFAGRDFEELKLLAHKLVAEARTVALLATTEGASVKLVFARSADLTSDMNALLKTACTALGGRGGGKPDFAQGGGGQTEQLETILAQAKETLLA